MALKPTIFKIKVSLSDLDREVYESLSLTIAQHPSETSERMMVRLLAYCLNYDEQLEFCKGLSDTEEPDLWARALTGETDLWIEVGEPAADRVKKVSRQAKKTIVYCFNTKSATWWQLESSKLAKLSATIIQFSWPEMKKLASLIERTMDISVTITGDSVYVAAARGEVELSLTTLQQ
ncbi:MAG: hypothetical protein ACJA2D_001438 [Pseudohongiellaceae bacterium]|jgi:uncharacterized protein YaeQ